MRLLLTILASMLLFPVLLPAQEKKVNRNVFFSEENPVDVTIVMDMKKFMSKKVKDGYTVPADFNCRLGDTLDVKERIFVEVRGKFRRENCYLPPLKLRFRNESSPVMSPLGSLKLVNPCDNHPTENDYLLREFLVYKMYNILTEKSLRVRLLNLQYIDSSGKRKPIRQNAFLIEDVDVMAKRNQCLERERNVLHTESTDRNHMTLVAVFEYMIGNTDWSVPAGHNIKLIVPREDTTTAPYPVPYDFDHAGLVNTSYALPSEFLPISSVRERLYRGYPRSLEELQEVFAIFRDKKDELYRVVNDFHLLSAGSRKDIIAFLDSFYSTINNPAAVRTAFIDNARNN